ncbi:hypothetical protein NKR23_g3717 [Pleurostoma richardsiae]|uniref:Uncharacterized protein n=1 Tax=Pleurostoma richardsiae TaxID=41990 RepID=A0AA38RL14_9PEZI|nr:hypothetical protein NKR23_g3717 [Pleurostoma richardsiae]
MASPRTLLGPLTTTWTPPAVCSYAMALCATCTTVWQAQTCNPSSKAHDWTDCWPPRWSSVTTDPGVMMGWGLYSPAYACPAGYTTAASATAGGSSGWDVEYSMETGETALACCPPDYAITNVVASSTTGQTCVITVSTSTSFSTVQCDDGSFADFSLVQVPEDASQYVIYAPLIQLNYKAADLPATSAATSSSSSVAAATSTSASPLPTSFPAASTTLPLASDSTTSSAASSSGSSATGNSTTGVGGGGSAGSATTSDSAAGQTGSSGGTSGNSSGGLSTGAAIGIGVGVGAGALALVAAAFLLYRSRRRRARAARAAASPAFPPDEKDPEKKKAAASLGPQAELPGQGLGELEARDPPQELATSPQRRGDTPPALGPVFRASYGFPYQEGPPVFELEGDSTPNTPVRKSREDD